MKTKTIFNVLVLAALILLIVACSGDGQVISTAETTVVISPEIAVEPIEEPGGTAGPAPTSTEGEVCTDLATGARMDYDEARAIAQASQCIAEGQLLENHFCNENSGTWWIDVAAENAGCNPACVVSVNSGAAEINWRCTGALPPTSDEEAASETSLSGDRPAPTVFDYSGWGTYINERHGYAVKYPPSVTPLWEDEALAVTFEGPLEDNEHWPMIFIGHGTTSYHQPGEGVKVRDWVETYSGQPENTFSEDTEIAGVAAYHVVQARSPQAYASDNYYFIKDGQLFGLVILHTGDKQDWQMYDQFLQSFTFLDPEGSPTGGQLVEAWTGVISANPAGGQSRYVFDQQDGQRWIVGTSDETMWAAIAEAAWRGVEVQLEGVQTPIPGLIDVASITLVGETSLEARNLSYFAQPSASSTLPADRLGTYHEWSAVDGQQGSPWCEGADGSGAGEWFELTFDWPVEATMIRLITGYAHDDDIFAKNNRVKRATFVFSEGERIEWQFDDTQEWQMVPLARAPGPNIITTSVQVFIDEVYPGSLYDDTCVGELEVWGRPQ